VNKKFSDLCGVLTIILWFAAVGCGAVGGFWGSPFFLVCIVGIFIAFLLEIKYEEPSPPWQ